MTGVVLVGLAFISTALFDEMTINRISQFAPEPVKVHPDGLSPTPSELMA